jgi:hypothetical protein
LISSETTDDYEWILRCLLEAGEGLAPAVIIVDEDPAMEAACAIVILLRVQFAFWSADDDDGNLVVTELKDDGVQTQEHLLEQLGCGLVNVDGDEIDLPTCKRGNWKRTLAGFKPQATATRCCVGAHR